MSHPTAAAVRRLTLLAALAALAATPTLLGAQQLAARPSDPVPLAAPADGGAPVAARASATSATATRTRLAPTIDGRDGDPAWREAQVIDQFLEYEPNPGAETRFKTEARVMYDDKALYVVVRMYDPAPDSIVSLLSRRDVRTASEQVKLMIDSYHDKRTGFEFILNPAGVKRDFYVYNDNNEDVTWDAVWDGAARVDSLGWVAEFRIPFSQLRYPRVPDHTFGFMIVRDVARTNARVSWPLYHRTRQGYMSQAGELAGLRGLPTPRRLEVSPYLVTSNVTQARTGTGATGFRHPQKASMGADVKYGLTPNLTIDATVNPDFGQVEADPAVLNLSAFEQFFDERRPFFLEGAGIFNFRTYCNDIDSGCRGLFYSRRIGRAPQLSGADAASPTFTTIQTAAKLTGRLANGLSIGVLDAVTQQEYGARGAIIEPRSNYFVGRVMQDLRGGQSGVGAMITAVNRDLDDASAGVLRRAAYTGGFDARHRFAKNNYELHAMVSGSLMRGSARAIDLLQRDGVHRFQRPDAGLPYDPARTSLGGDAQRLSVSKFGGGTTRFQSVYQRYGAGFESNDLGFQSRADEQMFRNWFQLNYQTPTKLFRSRFFNFNTYNAWTTDGLPLATGLNTNFHLQFRNTTWVHFGVNYNDFTGNSFDDRAARGGPAIRRSARANGWLGWDGDSRKPVTPYVSAGWNLGDEGNSYGAWLSPTVSFRLASRFSTSVGLNYEQYRSGAQWLQNFGVAGSDTARYTFAQLDQKIVSATTRMNFTMTPTLSLQVYAAPYVNTGTYSDWRQLANPRAKKFDDRFAPYAGDPGGFNFKQLRSNTVLRWEYRPGSTLFAVWQHGRDRYDPRASDFDFGRDYGGLLGLHPNNTFLLKFSYWINP